MTYNVFGGTVNLLNQSISQWRSRLSAWIKAGGGLFVRSLRQLSLHCYWFFCCIRRPHELLSVICRLTLAYCNVRCCNV